MDQIKKKKNGGGGLQCCKNKKNNTENENSYNFSVYVKEVNIH